MSLDDHPISMLNDRDLAKDFTGSHKENKIKNGPIECE
jgi:hypothetical protein